MSPRRQQDPMSAERFYLILSQGFIFSLALLLCRDLDQHLNCCKGTLCQLIKLVYKYNRTELKRLLHSRASSYYCFQHVMLNFSMSKIKRSNVPSMSSLLMMTSSSTSFGIQPRDLMAMPSSCFEMNPFPSRSNTLNASRISVEVPHT